ncbi:uncharacterized protein EV420DRAFT_1746766 [Desarmillaria tabescens]|uniref:Uncharacterized protein n=1 Tax=Armillaria tabescens TaxID=1929756 RepID=A0AA39N7K4_ARMTA|nr:uncharacterized protein EV420DRAFT_1746766 [Desarmillaria tabescens]KAK0460490.1 hypothetical protein EV420DRAFT_1746766 [Desarmillaria tabescens]
MTPKQERISTVADRIYEEILPNRHILGLLYPLQSPRQWFLIPVPFHKDVSEPRSIDDYDFTSANRYAIFFKSDPDHFGQNDLIRNLFDARWYGPVLVLKLDGSRTRLSDVMPTEVEDIDMMIHRFSPPTGMKNASESTCSTKLEKLLKGFTKSVGKDLSDFKCVNPNWTPAMYEMEDNDIIDAMLECLLPLRPHKLLLTTNSHHRSGGVPPILTVVHATM